MEFLQLENWMDSEHCLPVPQIRHLIIWFSYYTGALYLIFAFYVFKDIRPKLSYLLNDKFAVYLGLVFVFCGVLHMLHGTAYINQYSKLTVLLSYPALMFCHTKLLLNSYTLARKLKGLKTQKEIQEIYNQVADLRKKLHEANHAIFEAYGTKDVKLLKDYIKDGV